MRDRQYQLVFAAVALVLAVMLAGCGGTSSNNGVQHDTALVGTWMPVKVTVDGDVISLADLFDWSGDEARTELEFQSNAIVQSTIYDEAGDVVGEDEGTYTASGGQGIMAIGDDEDRPFNYSISGNVLTVSLTEDGHAIEMVMVRVVNLTAQDSNLVRTWKLTGVIVNGADAPTSFPFFDPSIDADCITVTLNSDGALVAKALNEDSVVLEQNTSMTWASGGGELVLTEGTVQIRGYYVVNGDGTASVVVLTTNGDTVEAAMEAWGEPGEHDPALVGDWQYVSGTVNGVQQPLAVIVDWPAVIVSLAMDFRADGTLLMSALNSDGDVLGMLMNAWSTDGDDLFMRLFDNTDFTYTVVGDDLVISSANMNGNAVELTFER